MGALLPITAGMDNVVRLTDADAASLDARIAQVVESDRDACVVKHFTYWYTARPPVHEALIERPARAA